MLLLLTIALAAENPVHASHGTVAAGAGLGVLSLGLLATHSGPHLDGQDVLALHSGGILLGTLGGALVVGGEGRAGNVLRDRGLKVPRGAWIASFAGLGVGALGGGCVLATQKRVTTEVGGYTQGAPAICSGLYVAGLGTTYTAGLVQALIDDAVTPDVEPEDVDDGSEDDDDGDIDDSSGGADGFRLQIAPTITPGGAGVILAGRFR